MRRSSPPRCPESTVALEELSCANRLRHVARLLAVPRTVLELDRGVQALSGVLEHRVAPARPRRPRHELVRDVHLLQRFLDPPARPALQPFEPTAMQLDHGPVSSIAPKPPYARRRPAEVRSCDGGAAPRLVRGARPRPPLAPDARPVRDPRLRGDAAADAGG